MTAAVVPPLAFHPSPELALSDPSAEARKRRREILTSHRIIGTVAEAVVSSAVVEDVVSTKKRRISTTDSSSTTTKPAKTHKRPQMKYDPDVPMTKEEAAVWRREQRRKRNRESAAASRQRQRDRITELEAEMDGWKTKYHQILAQIRSLEKATGATPSFEDVVPVTTRSDTPEPTVEEPATTVTPRASPTSHASSSSPSSAGESSEDESTTSPPVPTLEEQEQELQPPKMTSRPAES